MNLSEILGSLRGIRQEKKFGTRYLPSNHITQQKYNHFNPTFSLTKPFSGCFDGNYIALKATTKFPLL